MTHHLDVPALRSALSRFAIYPTAEQRQILDDAGAILVRMIENALPALYCRGHARFSWDASYCYPPVDDDTIRCDIIPKLLVDLP